MGPMCIYESEMIKYKEVDITCRYPVQVYD